MSISILELYREDLLYNYKDISISEILSYTYFNINMLTWENESGTYFNINMSAWENADIIIFNDMDGTSVELKNKRDVPYKIEKSEYVINMKSYKEGFKAASEALIAANDSIQKMEI